MIQFELLKFTIWNNYKLPLNFYFMKILLLISFSLLCTISVFSQDVIFTKSGDKIEAKIIEITTTTIKYKKFDQQDGPIRNIEKSEVKEIIYEDGQWDKFDEKEPKVEDKKVEEKKEVYRERDSEDHILNKGFFLDGMICYNLSTEIQESYFEVYDEFGNYLYTNTYLSTQNNNYFGLNVRLGSKWYFGSSDVWRPGIQATWARIGVFVPEDLDFSLTSPKFTLSLLNVGFANAIKFNESNGMEMNANVGFSMNGIPLPTATNSNLQIGVIFGADVKYRYNALAVGFDFSRINLEAPNGRSSKMNVMAVTIGFKM